MDYGDDRNDLIFTMLRDVHRFAVPLPDQTPGAGEVALPPAWRIDHDPHFADHAVDLRQFLGVMGISAGDQAILGLRRGGTAGAFTVDVRDDAIEVTAPDVTLMWRAVAWIERTMASRHAAMLPRGRREIRPRFRRRITTSMFAHGLEHPGDPLAYHDDYLRAMAHHGYSSLFLYLNLWPLVQSTCVPQFDAPDAATRRQELASLARRAARFGLDLVLLIAAPRHDADHPAFLAHPNLRGGIVMRPEGHCLCTSEPLTHDFYAEQFAGLCRAVPGLGALAFLIGGEGFLHCYTRPVPRTEHVTNCPRCGQRSPAQVLTPLLNRITAGVRDASPATRVIFWPYASHIWTHHSDLDYDWAQDKAIVANLDPRASWLCEIELHQPFEVEGIGRLTVTDYALHIPGPSTRLRTMQPLLSEAGIEMVVKTECNLDASFHSVAYIPALQRWMARHRAIAATDAGVVWETWRLNGYWDSPSIDAAFWLDLEPQLSDEQILRRIASRIYGPAACDRVLQAWTLVSDAWCTVYRNYGTYWWGPLVIGPAHLFDCGEAIFFPWTYSEGFFEVPAGLRETEKPEVLADPRRRTPRFATSPLGHVPQRLRDLGRAAKLCDEAAGLLEAVLAQVPTPLHHRARADADNALMCWIFLEADVAFHRFIQCRDEARLLGKLDPRRRELALQAAGIVAADLQRARLTLPILQRTPMLGWGWTFGVRFTASMVQEKIRRTETLLARLQQGQWVTS